MQEKLFDKTMEDIATYTKVLQTVVRIGLDQGIPEAGVTLENARKKLLKLSRERQKHEEFVSSLGYSSLSRALKALGQYKQGSGPINIEHLPEVFHKVPSVWLSGKPKTKKDPGFAPLRPRDAERQHRVITPLLLEAWEIADEKAQDTMLSDYLRVSANEFEKQLYIFINELEEVTFEDEIEERRPTSNADISNSLGVLGDNYNRYNVVPKDNEPPAPGM
jgi:hypothetical protein